MSASAFADPLGVVGTTIADKYRVEALIGQGGFGVVYRGTHLVLVPGSPATGDAPFDLMVEDLDATHEAWMELGVDVSEISRGRIHNAFEATDPDGYRVTVNSSHVMGTV